MSSGSLSTLIVPRERWRTDPREPLSREGGCRASGNCWWDTQKGRTQSRRMDVSTKQQRIAQLAVEKPEVCFTSLNQYLDLDWMKEAYHRTRRESAPGIDGQTMAEYGKDLESNLQGLIGRAKSGRYHAPPVRRVHIPKGDGKETR